MLDDWIIEDDDLDGIPAEFYAQVIITITDHAPLLAQPRLARLTMAIMADHAPAAPGNLWGYIVLPDTVRLVVGPTRDDQLATYIEALKTRLANRLLAVIRAADDDTLDAILRYNPVRGGAIYQVWQAGSHRSIFWTEYKLSNAIYDMQQIPVHLELVESAEKWLYCYIGGDAT